MSKRYSVYLAKDDTPLIIYASAEKCAEAMGITRNSFYKCLTRQRNNSKLKKWDVYEDEPEEIENG